MAAPQKLFITTPADSFAPPSDGVAVTGANTYYSKVFGAKNSDGQSIHLEWTGDPVGVLTLWCSDKPNPDESSDADWVEDTTFTPANPAGSADKMLDSAGNMKSNLKRIKYVNSAGDGVLYGWATVARS